MPTPASALTASVTGEILAELGRRRISKTAFASTLGMPREWVERRLNGRVQMSLDDLEKMCTALNLNAVAMMQRAAS